MSNDRETFKVLGRDIGTADYWDQTGDWELYLHDFKPFKNSDEWGERKGLNINFETGRVDKYNTEGTCHIEQSWDVIEFIQWLQKE